MSSQEGPQTAFALSLTGGILMLLGGGLSTIWFMGGGPFFGGMMSGGGMMGGWQGMMGGFGGPFSFMGGLSLVGLAAGIIVIIGALMLNTRPGESTTWGTLILVFSILSFLGMGGFFIGGLLGILGGALALSWRPSKA